MADFSPVINLVTNSFIVSDMLYRAARMAGALKQPGQGLTNSETQEFLQVLNAQVDSWKIESLILEYMRRTVQNMAIGQEAYSVGPGQNFDIERPEAIPRASFLVASTAPYGPAEIPMRVILTFEEWQEYIVKGTQSSYPLACYYQAAVPIGVFRVWPVPNATPQQIAIYTRQMMQEFATADDQVVVKDGWREMILYNLAVRIHQMPPYNRMPLDPSVQQLAVDSKLLVTRANQTPMYIGSDAGARQGATTGSWYGGIPKAWTPY